MKIEDLKRMIESKSINNNLLIFLDDYGFISHQYISEICKIKGVDCNFIENIEDYISSANDLFADVTNSTTLNVYKTDDLSIQASQLKSMKSLIIVTKKISDNQSKEALAPFIVTCPKIEEWWIKDYVYTNLKGIPNDKLDWLINICGKDLFRIEQEVNKLSLFSEAERDLLFTKMCEQGAYNDLTDYTIFSLVSAIESRNVEEVKNILFDIKNIDINEFALLALLRKSFRRIIGIQLGKNVCAKDLDISENQFYFYKKNLCNKYTGMELIDNLSCVDSIDAMVKTSKISANYVIDYLITHILETHKSS